MSGPVLMLLLGMASLQVWAIICWQWRTGRPVLETAPRVSSPCLAIAWPPVAVYVTYLAVQQTAAFFADPVTTPLSIQHVQSNCIDSALVIVIALTLLTGLGRTPLRECGFDLRNLGRQLSDGGRAFLASFGPVLLVLSATFLLRTEENMHPFLKLLRDDRTGETFAWIAAAAVILAPIKEELLFRVILQDGLARRIGPAPAIGIVAVLFCAVHGFPDSLALLPLAVILGYLYHQTQSAIAVMITHALFNLTNLLLLLLVNPE